MVAAREAQLDASRAEPTLRPDADASPRHGTAAGRGGGGSEPDEGPRWLRQLLPQALARLAHAHMHMHTTAHALLRTCTPAHMHCCCADSSPHAHTLPQVRALDWTRRAKYRSVQAMAPLLPRGGVSLLRALTLTLALTLALALALTPTLSLWPARSRTPPP